MQSPNIPSIIAQTQISFPAPLFEDDCMLTAGNQSDYLPEQSIEPFERFLYEDVYGAGPDGISCVQIMSVDRRILLAEPYKEGRVYTIDDPLTPISDRVPEIADLPIQSASDQHLEDAKERPFAKGLELLGWGIVLGLWLLYLVGLLLILVVPVGAVVALFLIARHFWRGYSRKSSL